MKSNFVRSKTALITEQKGAKSAIAAVFANLKGNMFFPHLRGNVIV